MTCVKYQYITPCDVKVCTYFLTPWEGDLGSEGPVHTCMNGCYFIEMPESMVGGFACHVRSRFAKSVGSNVPLRR